MYSPSSRGIYLCQSKQTNSCLFLYSIEVFEENIVPSLFKIVSDDDNISFEIVNKLLTKKEISRMIDDVYRHCGFSCPATKVGNQFLHQLCSST